MTLKIKNFGKIKKANMRLCPFTVIVGPNSSGKSFVTKALYSIFHAINQDLVANKLIRDFEKLEHMVKRSFHEYPNIDEKLLQPFLRIKQDIQAKIIILASDSEKNETLGFIHEKILLIEELIEKNSQKQNFRREIQKRINELKRNTSNYKEIYSELLQEMLKKEFIENFQIESLGILTGGRKNLFEILNFGELRIDNEKVNFSLLKDGVARFQELYNVVYLESPIYFKLKNPLREVRISRFDLFFRKDFLTQVPKYFYDVDSLLDSRIIQRDSDFNEIADQINKKIGGSLILNEDGIVFSEDTQDGMLIPLNMVSSGISNLGIIALLIKKNVLSKGSYLFIDEPEVNLHTEWQHVMLDILVQLSKKGVHVVIATHSLDMLYRLEYLVRNDKDAEKHFSINRLNIEGNSEERGELLEDIRKAKIDIGKPYMDLFDQRLP